MIPMLLWVNPPSRNHLKLKAVQISIMEEALEVDLDESLSQGAKIIKAFELYEKWRNAQRKYQ